MIATPSASLPWIAPTASTLVPPATPRRMTVIGRPSTDRPISTSMSVAKLDASIGGMDGPGGSGGSVVLVDVLDVVLVDVLVDVDVVDVVVLVVVVLVVVVLVVVVLVVVVFVVVVVGAAVVLVAGVAGVVAIGVVLVTVLMATNESADSAGVELRHPESASRAIAAATHRISGHDGRVRPAVRQRPA